MNSTLIKPMVNLMQEGKGWQRAKDAITGKKEAETTELTDSDEI